MVTFVSSPTDHPHRKVRNTGTRCELPIESPVQHNHRSSKAYDCSMEHDRTIRPNQSSMTSPMNRDWKLNFTFAFNEIFDDLSTKFKFLWAFQTRRNACEILYGWIISHLAINIFMSLFLINTISVNFLQLLWNVLKKKRKLIWYISENSSRSAEGMGL